MSSSPLRIRDVLNTEVLPVDKGLLMQKMALFVCGKQKGREPGGLGQSHRKQVPQSPRFGLVLQLVDRVLTPARATPSFFPPVFSFPLQMLFDKSSYTNFLPCGLSSGFDMMTWRNHYASSIWEKHHPAVYP